MSTSNTTTTTKSCTDVEINMKTIPEDTMDEVNINDNDDQKSDPTAGSNSSEDSSDDKSMDNNTIEEEIADELMEEVAQEVTKKMYCSAKLWIGLLLLSFIIFVIVDTVTTGYVRDGVESFLQWIEDNPVAGVFLFIIVYFLATILFIPGSILTLGSGFVFSMAFGLGLGVALGALAVFIGAAAGAIASFLLTRYLLREQVGKLSNKYAVFQALDQALQENGLKIFILLRLSPIIPFNIINYLGGASSVSFKNYALALLAILPGTILYVFLGASAGSLTDSAMSGNDPTVTIIVIVIGAVFGILAIYITTKYARKELNKVIAERQQQQDNNDNNIDLEEGVETRSTDGEEQLAE